MKEHGILFKPEMIKAILDGRKTMTRRVIKGEIEPYEVDGQKMFHYTNKSTFIQMNIENISDPFLGIPCRYSIGDLLYVKEAFNWLECSCYSDFCNHSGYIYKASYENGEEEKWKSPLFMPKAAARIWLEITDLKVDRLQDISTKDAVAEGVSYNVSKHETQPCAMFEKLWKSINGRESWDANPYVWAITFKTKTHGK